MRIIHHFYQGRLLSLGQSFNCLNANEVTLGDISNITESQNLTKQHRVKNLLRNEKHTGWYISILDKFIYIFRY